MKKTSYAIVGTGGRASMFIDPIASRFRDEAELVGFCDTSETRMIYHQQRVLRDYGVGPIPTYGDFDKMLEEQRPEFVIVCTPDSLHHEYIIRSLEFGADVISEKPLTTDAEKCRQIFAAVERTGRKVRTTFNMRWSPGVSKVRELIAQGEIGSVKHVDFEYSLNTSHGADYFRRWHSQKEYSGGLLIHKSTHHFDLVNWWLDAIPSQVFAMGDLVFYGKKNAVARGEEELTRYERYTGAEAGNDPFRIDMTASPTMTGLYLNAEAETNYIRDQNVFRDGITIEDSMSVLVRYRTGTMMAYSLNAYSPCEGFRAVISGDKGRITYEEGHGSHLFADGKKVPPAPGTEDHVMRLQLQRLFAEAVDIPVAKLPGTHGGGDPLIQEQIFSKHPPADPLKRGAGHEQGAASLLIGAAANQSITSGRAVNIDDLVPLNREAKHLSELV